LRSLSGDSQINLLRTNAHKKGDYQFMARSSNAHMRLLFFKSLFQRNSIDASDILDIVVKSENPTKDHAIINFPHISENE
jgi:hypothetical protein